MTLHSRVGLSIGSAAVASSATGYEHPNIASLASAASGSRPGPEYPHCVRMLSSARDSPATLATGLARQAAASQMAPARGKVAARSASASAATPDSMRAGGMRPNQRIKRVPGGADW